MFFAGNIHGNKMNLGSTWAFLTHSRIFHNKKKGGDLNYRQTENWPQL